MKNTTNSSTSSAPLPATSSITPPPLPSHSPAKKASGSTLQAVKTVFGYLFMVLVIGAVVVGAIGAVAGVCHDFGALLNGRLGIGTISTGTLVLIYALFIRRS